MMRRIPATTSLLLCGVLVIGVSGCKMPSAAQTNEFPMRGTSKMPATPAHAGSPMPGTGAISPMPGGYGAAPAAMATPGQIMPDAQSIARVGFFHPVTNSDTSGTAAACGCSGCGGSDCTTQPHGYILQSQTEWNAYGIDPQEFLCDGGDNPPAAVVRRDDSLAGIQPEDTVVHYTTEAGDIGIQASNRACLYAPRFASVRKITGAVAGGRAIGLSQMDKPVGTIRFEQQQPGLVMTDTTELAHAEVARRIDAMRERNRGVPMEGILQPEQAGDVLEAMAGLSIAELRLMRDDEKTLFEQLSLAAVAWNLDESLEVAIEDLRTPTLTRDEHLRGFTIYDFPDAGRLRISKLADRHDAQPGEIVNFSIHVENVGDSPVNQVVLVDNLTTRLEYVSESQECSVEAKFDAVANDGQSLKLQWELAEQLEVGESATIRFQCRVR